MGRGPDQKKLEGILRDKVVSAYLGYAMAFDEEKALTVTKQAQKTPKKIRR